jgi:hypothetical protein
MRKKESKRKKERTNAMTKKEMKKKGGDWRKGRRKENE